MQRTPEVDTVLGIIRRVLRTRTDWITQGQVLMEEIETAVKKAPEVKKV
jgi:hypothetical protein